MNKKAEAIVDEVKKVIIGKDDVIEMILLAILSKGHVLLEDVPGVGKTTMAMSFARTLGLDTKRIQFTSDTLPSDIVGFSVYDKEKEELAYKPGAILTNLLLADEINRTSSKTQSALLEAMEERHVTVDGITHDLPEPFVVLATQNPIGSAGTTNLPNSQLDRFLIRLSMGYPDLKSEIAIMKDRRSGNPLDLVKPVMSKEELGMMIEEAQSVTMADDLYLYASRLVQATRENDNILLGVSPRGALALCRAAKSKAYLRGRDFCIPRDITEVLPYVFCHRLMLSGKARIREVTAQGVLEEILSAVKKPDLKEFGV